MSRHGQWTEMRVWLVRIDRRPRSEPSLQASDGTRAEGKRRNHHSDLLDEVGLACTRWCDAGDADHGSVIESHQGCLCLHDAEEPAEDQPKAALPPSRVIPKRGDGVGIVAESARQQRNRGGSLLPTECTHLNHQLLSTATEGAVTALQPQVRARNR